MPISKGSTTSWAATNPIHYIKIPRYDSAYDYHLTVSVKTLGNVGSNNGLTLPNHRNQELEWGGWTKKGGINGSLFSATGNPQYSIGMEVVNYNVWYSGESQDAFDGCGIVSISSPNDVNLSLNQSGDTNGEMYAVTSAGCFIRNGADYNGKSQSVVNVRSGRSFVAKTANNIYLIATYGQSQTATSAGEGVVGYTNMRAVVREVASAAGDSAILEACVLDGGGSVALQYDGTNFINSTRLLKTAILVYQKPKAAVVPIDPPPPTVDPGILPSVPPSSTPQKLPYTKIGSDLKGIGDIRVMVGGALRNVQKAQIKQGGTLRTVYQRDIEVANFPQAYGTSYTWSTQSPTASTSQMVSGNPYITSFTASSFGNGVPSCAFDGNYGTSTGSNGFSNLPAVWTIRFNAYISIQSFTLHGWPMNHDYLNSPKYMTLQGSIDGVNWTTLYEGNVPNSWTGGNINYSSPMINTYTEAIQRADSATQSPATPGGQLISALSYKTAFFDYIRIGWHSNQANNTSADDTRKYYNEPYESYPFKQSSAIGLSQLSFNVVLRSK